MVYDPGAIDAALAAALGDEPQLIAELRRAFVDSAQRALAVLEAANADEWAPAAFRLKGLAASFGAVDLMALAKAAAAAPVGDPVMLTKLHEAIGEL
ncbi:Hpt domain-containing protein [Nostoc sp. 3335mG]|nr:Hpt domain-containing protein [Nostoc sp. 3335mG]